MYSLGQAIQIINRSTYKLGTSGVTGLLGGNNAVDALETIHLYAGRRWAGWYNYPGVLTVAMKFGQITDSRLWASVFPGPSDTPAGIFNLAGKIGPEYNVAYSGTKPRSRTKYLGYLMAEQCTECPSQALPLVNQDGSPGRKTGSSATVTVVSLSPLQQGEVSRIPTMGNANVDRVQHEYISIDPKSDPPLALWAIVPSLVSVLACVLCMLAQDPLCASLILLGIVSSGISSFVLGTAKLKIRVSVSSLASPSGERLLFPEGGNIIVLKGEEADVNIITEGEFELGYSTGMSLHRKHPAQTAEAPGQDSPTVGLPPGEHRMVGISCLLLGVQFVAQLLLIPRCTFFGQILFLVSFIASGMYHLYVASFHRESVHWVLLSRKLPATMEKWTLGTRTQMAVFVCLNLGNSGSDLLSSKIDAVLTNILPNVNGTPVWRYWKAKVLKEMGHFWNLDAKTLPYTPNIQAEHNSDTEAEEYSKLTDEDKALLNNLIDDAWCVFSYYASKRQDGDSGVMQGRWDCAEEKVDLLPLA